MWFDLTSSITLLSRTEKRVQHFETTSHGWVQLPIRHILGSVSNNPYSKTRGRVSGGLGTTSKHIGIGNYALQTVANQVSSLLLEPS